jgi:hypothetical protein
MRKEPILRKFHREHLFLMKRIILFSMKMETRLLRRI